MELVAYESTVIPNISKKVPVELLPHWAALGASAEMGEVSAVIEKALRKKGYIDPDDETAILDEVGDVLWFLVALLYATGWTLEDAMKYNVKKLEDRRSGLVEDRRNARKAAEGN